MRLKLKNYKESVTDSCDLEDIDDNGVIPFDKFIDVLKNLDITMNAE